MRGVSVNILRSDLGDCTNRGVTSPALSKGRVVVLFDPEIQDGNYRLEDCKDDPKFVCLRIVRRWVGTPHEYLHCEPINDAGAGRVGPMAGGNFVFSSDSRFSNVSRYPLPVHDRFE